MSYRTLKKYDQAISELLKAAIEFGQAEGDNPDPHTPQVQTLKAWARNYYEVWGSLTGRPIPHGEEIFANKDALISQIVEGVGKHHGAPIYLIEAVLYEGDKEVLRTEAAKAIGYLVDGIYWDENTNWSKADRAEVRLL